MWIVFEALQNVSNRANLLQSAIVRGLNNELDGLIEGPAGRAAAATPVVAPSIKVEPTATRDSPKSWISLTEEVVELAATLPIGTTVVDFLQSLKCDFQVAFTHLPCRMRLSCTVWKT